MVDTLASANPWPFRVGEPRQKGVHYCCFANPCLTRDQDDLTDDFPVGMVVNPRGGALFVSTNGYGMGAVKGLGEIVRIDLR